MNNKIWLTIISSSDYRFKILLSLLFLIYLILDGIRVGGYFSFVLALILVFGLVLDFFWSLNCFSFRDEILISLGIMMKKNGLEMRIKLHDGKWNVTLIRNVGGITRMAGRGTSLEIGEAVLRAEEDFDNRK